MGSDQHFAHVMTAELSWHVQSYGLIRLSEIQIRAISNYQDLDSELVNSFGDRFQAAARERGRICDQEYITTTKIHIDANTVLGQKHIITNMGARPRSAMLQYVLNC